MNTAVVRFVGHRLDSPEVQERLRVVDSYVGERVENINERSERFRATANARIGSLIRSSKPLREKIPAFWKIVDEFMSFNGDDVACKRGCCHCCHGPILVPHGEAHIIAARIGTKAVNPKPRASGKGIKTGYENPCTFLKSDGDCSIYENRPTVCRAHYSMDVDSLLCELGDDGKSKPVPFLNDIPIQQALLMIVGASRGRIPDCADIRDFFGPNREVIRAQGYFKNV